jgi:hypothetical protein
MHEDVKSASLQQIQKPAKHHVSRGYIAMIRTASLVISDITLAVAFNFATGCIKLIFGFMKQHQAR